MFRLFRKKRERKPTPPWMMWIAVVFIIYAVLTNGTKKILNPSDEKKQGEVSQNKNNEMAELPSLGSLLNPEKLVNFEILKDRIFPKTTIRLQVKDTVKGNGIIAICGQKTTIKYSSFTEDGKEIEKDKETSLQIGEGKSMPALERGILGMEKSGKRIIISPGYLAYGAENFTRDDVPALANIQFRVDLLNVSPPIPEHSAYRIIGEAQGFDNVYSCGSQITLQMSIWDTQGKKLFDTKENDLKPINFTLGRSEVFLGLEQGVLGMNTGEHRVLVVPPTMQKTMYGNKPVVDFPLPENQTILVYVDAIP